MTSNKGEKYRIFVSYPETDAPTEGWPVLYVLDGNAVFASFAEARRIQEASEIGNSIIVGIGYPTNKPYDAQRLYDFTAGPTDSLAYAALANMRSGGQDQFLEFLTGQLRAEIAKRYKINLNRQALFGHSLGGLFAVHVLFTQPGAFHAIIAASPSLFWHEQEMLKQEQDFTTRLKAWEIPKVSRLMVVAGELEETRLELWAPEAFIKRMEPLSAYGLLTQSEIYASEGHMTVPNRSITQALRFAFSWP
ncbi:alpha/beta hydrolase [Kordiimonas pumila]|uniref:Alpha/beta hydrolase n=1 Tax=Kordiimonas pumila TaxID=2161677 RepID=A0ABV7D203_9PROT|nr:alpha/beta hydrolase-fold protein [Kordiimonas pumila]